MKTNSRKRSPRVGGFIARVYDVYFPHDRDDGGTDADHVPVIPGSDFPSDANRKNESPFQYLVPGDADMTP